MATKKIENYKYTAITQDGKEVEESLINVLTRILALASQDLKGIDQFREYNNFSKAFQKAEKDGFIELPEKDYKTLKIYISNYVPVIWGMNTNIYDVIEKFLNA